MAGWRRLSLRASLTLWSVCVTVAVVLAYAVAVFGFLSRSLSANLDQRLRDDFQWAATMADRRVDGTLQWFDEDVHGNADIPWLQVWSGDRVIFRTAVADRNPIPALDAVHALGDGRVTTFVTPRLRVRALTATSYVYGTPLVLQVARSETPMRQELWELTLLFLLGLPLAVAAAGIGGYVLAWRTVAPIQRMARRAREITADRLNERLPVQNPGDELGQLAMVFNDTLARLECSFERMRQFTADVSHQLRTPLTAMTSVAEVALRDRRPTRAYRSVIESMLEDVNRLSGLVNRLLTLSRAESGATMLNHEPVDLRHLIEDVASELMVLAREKEQTLTTIADDAPRVFGDSVMLREAVMNLVDNAVRYAPPGGIVEVRAWSAADSAWIEVRDDGPGVPANVREWIVGEASSRSGAINRRGRHGLGLAIARWAIEAHHGRLVLSSSNEGTSFGIVLPQRSELARKDDHGRTEAARVPDGAVSDLHSRDRWTSQSPGVRLVAEDYRGDADRCVVEGSPLDAHGRDRRTRHGRAVGS